jgi:DNA-binding GntR family transcriptional regulator
VSAVSDSGHDHARVYNELKAIVIAYRFRPGEQLLIGELADRLRVSSTPVREALIRLQAEGLLDPIHRRGFFARTLSSKEMIDLYECGALLLKQALAQGTDELDVHAFAAFTLTTAPPVVAANEETEVVPEGRVRQCADYLERVYEGIAYFSRNDVLISAVRNIMDRTHYIRLIDLEVPERLNHAVRCVSEIAAALQAREVGRAAATLEQDFTLIVRRMPLIIREGVSRAYALNAPSKSIAVNGLAGTRSHAG